MLGSGLTEQPRGSSRYEEMDRERESESTLVLVPGSVVVSFGSPGTATREDLAKHEPSPQQETRPQRLFAATRRSNFHHTR